MRIQSKLPFSQAKDQNPEYGVVYAGKDVSKTTDVNSDYYYDTMTNYKETKDGQITSDGNQDQNDYSFISWISFACKS